MNIKILLFGVIVTFSLLANGQSQRYVVFEEFTNASCGPCASQNPGFQAVMNANTSKCTYITYHWNFPGPNDPMYLANPADMLNRIGYYGFNGVPSAVNNGITIPNTCSYYEGAPKCITQSVVDAEYAIPSPFELYVNQQLSPGNDSIYITVQGKATGEVSGSLALQTVVVEKKIHYISAPGSNGEKDFHNVMRKMLPGPTGTALPASFQPGDYFVYKFAWKLTNIISNDELSVISFIQNTSTKKVLQAANASATPITGIYQNDISLQNPGNLLASYCENTIEPTFELQNNGSLPVTTAEIKYKVNNEPEKTYTWIGTLGFLDKTTIALPSIPYTVQSSNTLKIIGVKTNATADDYKKNDTIKYSFTSAMLTPALLKLFIKTDKNPGEITWDIKDKQGKIMQSGGPYSQASYSNLITLNYLTPDCYEFTIHDAGGNGLTVPGNFSLYYTAGTNVIILSGSNFGSSATCQFSTFSAAGVDPTPDIEPISVYPNPVSGKTLVSLQNNTQEKVSIQVYNMQGKLVINQPSKKYQSGNNEFHVDFSNLTPGIYSLRVKTGSNVYTKKITVSR